MQSSSSSSHQNAASSSSAHLPQNGNTNGEEKDAKSSHVLLPFLQSQSQNTLTRLYQKPSACLAVFRLLSPLERQLVMNLLWLDSAISPATMAAWVVRDRRNIYDRAIQELMKLHILVNSTTKLVLNNTFKASFRHALTGGGTSGSFGVAADERQSRMSLGVEQLDHFALERWETILHYMVSSGTGQQPERPSKGVLFLLERSALMASMYGAMQITSTGFQFLLHSPHDQLWDLLLQYLHLAQERDMDLVDVLSFLFMLSTMELGRTYTASNLTATQKVMLKDLRDYGVIYHSDNNAGCFSPTRLATTLTSSAPPLPTGRSTGGGAQGEGFIVLETNYRLYAYTDNPLQTAVLNLFVTLKYRFANLVVGSLTRESVRRALTSGISADQIISYLVTHAHPQMRKNEPLLPVTVQDQIRLWELEKNRLQSADGYLYTSFASQADYEFVLEYAHSLDVVLWEDPVKRCFFGKAEGHGNIRGFIERRTGGAL